MTDDRIHTAPKPGDPHLGRTLPSLAYDGAHRFDNPKLLCRPEGDGWKCYSAREFCDLSEALGLGLLDLGLSRGDRVGMFMFSDVNFCVADMGCLIAGLVDVPMYLTQETEAVRFIMMHSGATGLIVSNQAQFESIWPAIRDLPSLQHVVVVRSADLAGVASQSESVRIHSIDEILDRGRAVRAGHPGRVEELLSMIDPHDLATIIYTSGTTGRPKGVMLTHENISSNGLTSFSELKGYKDGPGGENGISFLPLTHVFARTLHYGFLAHGTTNHFVRPDELADRFREVKPTIFATVPRVLEKVYAGIQSKSEQQQGFRQTLALWAFNLAQRFELGRRMPISYRLKRRIADVVVYSKWREALGGCVSYVIAGGAALNAELANFFGAAGVDILQGYGLTETSPVITFNRAERNRAGTVGEPIPGVEVMIAGDGEVLTRGPHVMLGYYLDDDKTREVIDDDGWFHTGDIGHFNDEGRLVITDRKKDLFKLSTGKYVAPQVLENALTKERLIEQIVVFGPGRRFCAALLFPAMDAVREMARQMELDPGLSDEQLLNDSKIRARFQRLVDNANKGRPRWETIKKFRLIAADVTVDSGLLTPTLKVKRPVVVERFGDEIEQMYREEGGDFVSEITAA